MDNAAPQSTQAIDRRSFMAYFSSIGLGSTALPAVLWEQQQEEGPITVDTLVDAEAMIGLAPSRRFEKYAGSLMLPVRSFSALEPGDMDTIETLRLAVATAKTGESLEKLSIRTGNS